MIIGISGKKLSGKTTSGLIIQRLLPNTLMINFADSLKEEVAKAINKSVPFLEQHKSDYRSLLQVWGTEYRRNICGNDYWCDKWQQKVSYIVSNRQCNIVCGDVRFFNEAAVIKSLGGILVRVNRFSENIDNHASENDLDNYIFDMVLENNSTIEELEQQIKKKIKI